MDGPVWLRPLPAAFPRHVAPLKKGGDAFFVAIVSLVAQRQKPKDNYRVGGGVATPPSSTRRHRHEVAEHI